MHKPLLGLEKLRRGRTSTSARWSVKRTTITRWSHRARARASTRTDGDVRERNVARDGSFEIDPTARPASSSTRRPRARACATARRVSRPSRAAPFAPRRACPTSRALAGDDSIARVRRRAVIISYIAPAASAANSTHKSPSPTPPSCTPGSSTSSAYTGGTSPLRNHRAFRIDYTFDARE